MSFHDIADRLSIWLKSCRCGDGDVVYCTPCEMMFEAVEKIEFLESVICAKSFEDGQSKGY